MAEKTEYKAKIHCPSCNVTSDKFTVTNGTAADSMALCPACGAEVALLADLKAAAKREATMAVKRMVAQQMMGFKPR